MIQIDIIAVGKLKEDYLKEGIAEYQKRMPPLAKLRMIEIVEEKCSLEPTKSEIESVKTNEGKRILAHLPEKGQIFVLDLRGQMLSSEQLAEHLLEATNQGASHFTFVIGGSFGLSKAVCDRAALKVSFGRMTYPHQLMRLILLEQIYRVLKINRNEPYHK